MPLLDGDFSVDLSEVATPRYSIVHKLTVRLSAEVLELSFLTFLTPVCYFLSSVAEPELP